MVQYNQKKKRGGFTLIELLVVIAIIGVLSAVVLASLSTARNKGGDASIQANLSTIQTQAEIYYSDNGSYGGVAANSGTSCPATVGTVWAHSTIKNAVTSAKNSSNGLFIGCNSNGTAFAVIAQFTSPTTITYWCVDSTGRARATANQLGANTVCQ